MKKFFLLSLVVVCFACTLFGCARHALVAYIREGTSAGSDIYTVNVSFAEDQMYENKKIDMLLRSSIDNLTITFKREFDEDTNLLIQKKEQWYSLTLLLNQQGNDRNEEYMPYNEKHNITMMFESEQNAMLTIKSVCGDEYENSSGDIILINQVDISKPFELDLGKNMQQ